MYFLWKIKNKKWAIITLGECISKNMTKCTISRDAPHMWYNVILNYAAFFDISCFLWVFFFGKCDNWSSKFCQSKQQIWFVRFRELLECVIRNNFVRKTIRTRTLTFNHIKKIKSRNTGTFVCKANWKNLIWVKEMKFNEFWRHGRLAVWHTSSPAARQCE